MKFFRGHILLTIILILVLIPSYANKDTLLLNKKEALDSADFYSKKGEKFWQLGDFDKFEEYLKKALSLKLVYLDSNSIEFASTYHNLGVAFKQQGKYQKALKFYSKSEKIYLKNQGPEYKYLSLIYLNKANIYVNNHDFDKAFSYYKKSQVILEKSRLENITYLSMLYNSLGNLFKTTGVFEKANDYYLKSVIICEFYNNKLLPQVYGNMANNYKKFNYIEKANEYYHLAITSAKKTFNNNHYRLANKYLNYGQFCFEQGNNKKALDLYKKAYDIYLINFKEKHPKTSRPLLRMGDVYLKQNKINKALDYYQKSLMALSEEYNNKDIYSNPDIEEVTSQTYFLEILKSKALALFERFNSTQNIEDIKTSLTTNNLAIELVEKMRTNYQSEESKLFLSENETETFHMAVRTSLKLFEVTSDTIYKNLAFQYAEKNKAASLLASLKDSEAKDIGGIPINLQKKEENLKREMALYKEFVYEEKRLSEPNKEKINLWEGKLFALNRQYDSLITSLEQDYPKYFSLKYKHDVIDVNTLKNKLHENETFIEYALSDTILYIFAANKSNFSVITQAIDSNFYISFDKIRNSLTNNNFSLHSLKDFEEFTNASYHLYKVLIKPVEKLTASHNLIIVPDERLAYLPFDVLLTSNIKTKNLDYKNLPYLIKKYTTGYSYSASLLFSEKEKGKYFSNRLLAFAPSYEAPREENNQAIVTRQHYRNKLFPIPGVKKEVENIVNIIGGSMFMDKEATEKTFKDLSGNYDILHLAMHTIIDDTNPMFSKLAFAQTQDTSDDGFLNTHEIYNMNLKAKLAVLSSCNSGNGKLRKGEGVMSLARGFIYSGCPSIVMTLWSIEDKSSVDLMSKFYKYLTQGQSKTDALRNAKLEFLNHADQLKSHPYFWASYVSIGDQNPIYRNRNSFLMIFVVIGIAALGVFFFRNKI